jgi:hypothetical protein
MARGVGNGGPGNRGPGNGGMPDRRVEGGGMRALKIATIAMGVLILLGTAVIVATIVKRTTMGQAGSGLAGQSFAAVLDEPAGTGIVSVAAVRDRLVVQLHGGGPDRLLLIDPASGAVVGRVTLGR